MEKKRLLKDLPFGNLSIGMVLTKGNGGYYIERGYTFYSGGGSSHNGWEEMSDKETEIINLIWENDKWFQPATLEHIDIKVYPSKIEIIYQPLDLGQAQTFAQGLESCLSQYGCEDKNYAWKDFKGFSILLK